MKRGIFSRWSKSSIEESLSRNRRKGKCVKVLNDKPVDLANSFSRERSATCEHETVEVKSEEKWPFYINSKGERVYVVVSKHALDRFTERSRRLNGVGLCNPIDVLVKQFNCSKRVFNLNKIQKKRVARYKGDTLFFRFFEMTFVVCDSTIVTVELAGKKTRSLN